MGKSLTRVRLAIAFILFVIVTITASQTGAQTMQPVTVSLWAITVRGTEASVELVCGDETATVWQLDPTRRGWNGYTFTGTLPADCDDLVLEIESEFPPNSLGWKFKGVDLRVNGGSNLIINGCFDNGLAGWDNVTGAYSWSVAGGTKNLIPGVCGDTLHAAKHGPERFTGGGVPGVPATLRQVVTP